MNASFSPSLSHLYAFGLVFLRLAGLLVAAPGWSARFVPNLIRVGFAVWAAVALYLGLGTPSHDIPASLGTLASEAIWETLLGLCGALSAKFIMDAAQAAGQTAALTMGLGFGAVLDPTSGAESAAVGELFSTIAICTAVALGIHREALMWLASSFRTTPLGSPGDVAALAAGVVTHAILGVALAVRVAFPLLVAVTFGYGVLGLLSRAAPQLNISSLGYSVAIVGGGSAIYFITPAATKLCAQMALNVFLGHG